MLFVTALAIPVVPSVLQAVAHQLHVVGQRPVKLLATVHRSVPAIHNVLQVLYVIAPVRRALPSARQEVAFQHHAVGHLHVKRQGTAHRFA